MAKMSRKKMEAWDTHNTAMHEAAHLTVAVAKGIVAGAVIGYVGKSVDPNASTTREGRRQTITPMGGQEAVCCVAGEVSRYLDGESGQMMYEDIEHRIEEGGVSATDLAGYPKSKRKLYAVIDEAAILLHKHRAYFDWATQKLLDDGEVGLSEAWIRFHGIPEEISIDELAAVVKSGPRKRSSAKRSASS